MTAGIFRSSDPKTLKLWIFWGFDFLATVQLVNGPPPSYQARLTIPQPYYSPRIQTNINRLWKDTKTSEKFKKILKNTKDSE